MHRGLPPEMIIGAFSLVARAFDWRDRNGQIIERIIAYAKRSRWEGLAGLILMQLTRPLLFRILVTTIIATVPIVSRASLRASDRSTMKNGL